MGCGSWGRWTVLEERWRIIGKDVEKMKFVLEFISCGGCFNPEQQQKSLGVHRNWSQTFRREKGKLRKNYPESLGFNKRCH